MGNHLGLDKNSEVIANTEAGQVRASSPGDVQVILPCIDSAEDLGVTLSSPDIQPCATPNSTKIVSVAPQEHSTPRSEGKDDILSKSFPARPVRSIRNLMEISMEEKQAVKRKLPVPRSSGATSPALSQSFSTSSQL